MDEEHHSDFSMLFAAGVVTFVGWATAVILIFWMAGKL